MSIAEARAHLLTATTSLERSDPTSEVSACLLTIEEALRIQDPGKTQLLRVFGKPVFYSHANARTTSFNIYLERNPEIANSFTQAEWAYEEAHFGIVGDALHLAVQKGFVVMAGTLQSPVFAHSFFARVCGQDDAAAREAHASRDIEWHEFVLFLETRKVYIYDPPYNDDNRPLIPGAPRRRLLNFTMVGAKANEIIYGLRTKRNLKVDEIYIGGGGNETGDSKDVSRVDSGSESRWTFQSGSGLDCDL